MKTIINTFFAIILLNSMPYSQQVNFNVAQKDPQKFLKANYLSIIDDFAKDGELETLSADIIKKVGKNTYWVKSARIIDSKDQLILELGLYLLENSKKAINQVPALNGYIIELVGSASDWRNMYIWLANESGEKDSDTISLEFNSAFTLMY